jgi:hypothetical protein
MLSSRRHSNEIKFNTHGFFSSVARKTGYSVSDVNTVYTWYINKSLEGAQNTPACKVKLAGLGSMKFSPGLSIRNLTGFITGLETAVNEFLDPEQEPKVAYSIIVTRHKVLLNALYSFRERITKLKDTGFVNETYYINKMTRSEQLENQLNQIYESIQRIPEYQQKRTSERGQDFTWTDEQGSKPF